LDDFYALCASAIKIDAATQKAVIALVVLTFDTKPVLAGWQIIRP
jgi:hypothetical protein